MKKIPTIFDMDYPDPDILRVKDDYYMVTTTMHFMPGCEILHSKDLRHWEHLTYVYDALDHTKGQRLEENQQIYGKGMWAASLRWHKETFYICFVANDTRKTYLFTSKEIKGPWKKSIIQGFYHDASLYFEDDKAFLIYGNNKIYITELESDLSKPKENGLHKMLIQDKDNPILGYEGSHFYKIGAYYYLFVIHSNPKKWKRTQACFFSDCLEGTFQGKDIYDEDNGFFDQGIAQGGVVDDLKGNWYTMLFQDKGASGRMPVLVPLTWEKDFPVLSKPLSMDKEEPQGNLVGDDDFRWEKKLDGTFIPKEFWQWNHEPDDKAWSIDKKEGGITFKTSYLAKNLMQAKNTLTQRTSYPKCEAWVTIDFQKMQENDYAGISAFMGNYGMIAVTKEDGKHYICMQTYPVGELPLNDISYYAKEAIEQERIEIKKDTVTLKVELDFSNQKEEANFFYATEGSFKQLGITHNLKFQLDHFCGCRFALFYYATKKLGGSVTFQNFMRIDK